MALTTQEQAVVAAAEQMMVEAMARYDPSHDKYHGEDFWILTGTDGL